MKQLLSLIACLLLPMGAMAQLSNWSILPEYSGATQGYDTWVVAKFETNQTSMTYAMEDYEVAAFVGDEEYPRATAHPQQTTPTSGVYYVTLQIKGNINLTDNDEGKPITFVVYNGNNGCEYELDSSIDVTWSADAPTYRPTFTLTAVLKLALQPITMIVGDTVDIKDYMVRVPANGKMPINILPMWNTGNNGEYIEINGDSLIALKASADDLEYTMEGPFWVTGKVHINEPPQVSSFTVTHTPAATGTGTLQLVPDIIDPTIDLSDFTVKIADSSYPAGWTVATMPSRTNNTADITLTYQIALPGAFALTVEDSKHNVYPLYDALNPDPSSPLAFGSIRVPALYDFNAGWQWRCNSYGSMTDEFDTFFNPAFVSSFKEARTQTELLINDPEWGLFRSTYTFTVPQGACYKILMDGPASTSLATGSFPQTPLTVNLKRGWLWVGSPFTYNRLISNAIDMSTPDGLTGLRIVSKTGGFAEWNGTAWTGTLTVIEKNQGYLVYFPSYSPTKKLVFSDEKTMAQGDENPAGARVWNNNQRVWHYDASRFANNMTMVAQLKNADPLRHYSIGAFVDGECRGEGQLIDGKLFVTVHANSGEQVSFSVCDELTGEYYDVMQTVMYQPMMGSLESPVMLSLDNEVTAVSAAPSALSAPSECYDLMGRKNPNARLSVSRMANGKMRKIVK